MKKRDAVRKPFDMAQQRAMGTELEAFNAAKKYNRTPSDRAKQLAYERVSWVVLWEQGWRGDKGGGGG